MTRAVLLSAAFSSVSSQALTGHHASQQKLLMYKLSMGTFL
jgi:hypothetical protein